MDKADKDAIYVAQTSALSKATGLDARAETFVGATTTVGSPATDKEDMARVYSAQTMALIANRVQPTDRDGCGGCGGFSGRNRWRDPVLEPTWDLDSGVLAPGGKIVPLEDRGPSIELPTTTRPSWVGGGGFVRGGFPTGTGPVGSPPVRTGGERQWLRCADGFPPELRQPVGCDVCHGAGRRCFGVLVRGNPYDNADTTPLEFAMYCDFGSVTSGFSRIQALIACLIFNGFPTNEGACRSAACDAELQRRRIGTYLSEWGTFPPVPRGLPKVAEAYQWWWSPPATTWRCERGMSPAVAVPEFNALYFDTGPVNTAGRHRAFQLQVAGFRCPFDPPGGP